MASVFKIIFLAMVVTVFLPLLSSAKLSTDRSQETKMVNGVVRVVERWEDKIPIDFKKDPANQKALDEWQKRFDNYESGIFKDMNISSDMALFFVYAQQRHPNLLTAIDQFDSSAFYLSKSDQIRYYSAKYQVHHFLFESTQITDSVRLWMKWLVKDSEKLVKLRFDLNRTLDKLVFDINRYELLRICINVDSLSNSFRRIAAKSYVASVNELHQKNKKKDALVLAKEATREIKPERNVCSDDWTALSVATCAKCYDKAVVRPLAGALGSDGQLLIEDLCSKYWNNEPLIVLLLVQLTKPTSVAFSYFKKAGESDAFKTDNDIVLAEMMLWKRAKRLKEFKVEYPERYKFAMKVSGVKVKSKVKKR